MDKDDHSSNVPFEIFHNHPKGGFPKAELSLILARSGVGKSSALINFGLDCLRRGHKVIHFSIGMSVEKVHHYYREIDIDHFAFHKPGAPSDWDQLQHDLTVVSYLDPEPMVDDLSEELQTLSKNAKIDPALVLVDGLDADEECEVYLEKIASVAKQHDVSILAAMTVHRDHASGALKLDKPLSMAQNHARNVFFMDPGTDRIRFEILNGSEAEELPIYFNPTKMIFCKS